MDDYLRIFKDKDFQAAQFKKYNIGCMIISPRNKDLIKFGNDNNWSKDLESGGRILMTRHEHDRSK